MKRVLIIGVITLLSAGMAFAQGVPLTAKYFNKTEAGYAFGIGKFQNHIIDGIRTHTNNDQTIFSLQTVNGFMFNDRVGVGAGFGIEFWEKGIFYPLFGQLSYYLKPAPTTFYANASLGYGFGNRDETTYYASGTGGSMFSIGIGYAKEISPRFRFHFEVCYQNQALQSAYNVYINDTLRSQVDYKIALSFIGFRVGIHFK